MRWAFLVITYIHKTNTNTKSEHTDRISNFIFQVLQGNSTGCYKTIKQSPSLVLNQAVETTDMKVMKSRVPV